MMKYLQFTTIIFILFFLRWYDGLSLNREKSRADALILKKPLKITLFESCGYHSSATIFRQWSDTR